MLATSIWRDTFFLLPSLYSPLPIVITKEQVKMMSSTIQIYGFNGAKTNLLPFFFFWVSSELLHNLKSEYPKKKKKKNYEKNFFFSDICKNRILGV